MSYKTTTLDNFITLQRGYDLPAQDRIKGDVPIIAANGPVGYHNVSKVNAECVVLGRSGSVGNPQLISEPFWPLNTTLFVKEFHGNNPIFVYYVLKTIDFKSFDAGGTVPTLNRNHLTQIQVPLVDSKNQITIAGILRNLDNKIAANNALSKTLEEIAQTIFKSWFIDFDPVRAKMAGEKPVAMDAATAALFPDSMEESELGLIPKGWEVKSLDEISEYLNGLAMQKFPVVDESSQLPVIKIAQLRAGNTMGADKASGSLNSKYVIKDGDILFSWSGTLEVETWAGGPGALNQHLFKVSGLSVPSWFSYLSTKYFLTVFRQIASGKATTMGHIQRGHLSESKLAMPSNELMTGIGQLIGPMISMKVNALVENRTIAETRDSLLPRLISGELQIPEEMLIS